MYTIKETTIYTRLVNDILTDEEQGEFNYYIATNPLSGVVIPESGGCRKVRWKSTNSGKRGGIRVIYYNQLDNGQIALLMIYGKTKQDNIPGHILKKLKEELVK